MSENKNVIIKNRSRSAVVYSLDDPKVRRDFAPGQSFKIPMNELEALTYKPGGMALLRYYLQVMDEDVVNELNMRVEPEYWLDEEGVKDLLLNGSVEALIDCLNFAPPGVIELVKKLSYELPVADMRKIAAIKKIIGFDVTATLNNIAKADEEEEASETKKPERLVKSTKTPTRQAATPNYKIVTKAVE